MPPAISVVLPARNAARWLADAVESILGQSFGDFELIALDDGSSDGTRAILEAFAGRDARVAVVDGPARGISAVLNTGLERARGALVARMDADDVAHPERFARQHAYLTRHPKVVALGSDAWLIDAWGGCLGRFHKPCDHETIDALLLRGQSSIPHGSAMLRRAAVEAAGGYRPAFDFVEDQDLWLRLAERGHLANLPEALLCYRQHLGNICSNRQAEQRQRTLAMLQGAYARRGLEPPVDLAELLPGYPSRAWLARHWLKAAIKAGEGRSAVGHAARLVREYPGAWNTWRTLPRLLGRPRLIAEAWAARGRAAAYPAEGGEQIRRYAAAP